MKQDGCILDVMKRLLEEQDIISFKNIKFQFICNQIKRDTIPFSFVRCEGNNTFIVQHNCMPIMHFRLEKLDEKNGCAHLLLLEAVDMEGNPVDPCDNFYALRKTTACIIVNIYCFQGINPLPPELVNRKLPVIEPKC